MYEFKEPSSICILETFWAKLYLFNFVILSLHKGLMLQFFE